MSGAIFERFKMHTNRYELPIRVLFYREGKDFVAHALELDLVAYGRNEKAAAQELEEMMMAQMSYASQLNEPELVYHPAPKEFFDRWESAHMAAFGGKKSKDRTAKIAAKAVVVTFEEGDIRAAKARPFQRATKRELAKAF